MYLAGGGGLILALLVGGYVWRKKRSAKLENSLLGVTTTDSSSVFGTTGGRSVDTGGSSLQTDFSQSGIGAIDTDEVDPVAEADVYMAYGRDAQAEEILKEALQKDPNRQAVRVKLLEIYAARKDLKAFETTAGRDLRRHRRPGAGVAEGDGPRPLDRPDQPDVRRQAGGGRGCAPAGHGRPAAAGRRRGRGARPPTSRSTSARSRRRRSTSIWRRRSARDASAAPDLSLDVASQAPADLGFDLDLGGDSQKPAEEQSDFSPSGTFIMDAATKKAVSDMVESQSQPGALSIDFELPGTKPAGGAAISTTRPRCRPRRRRGGRRRLRLQARRADQACAGGAGRRPRRHQLRPRQGRRGAGAPVDARWQEVATKLDLAKAYEEMGDKDGARELLNEVMKEGDAAQQQQAKQMLDALK